MPELGLFLWVGHDRVDINGETIADVTTPDPEALAYLRERLTQRAGAPVILAVEAQVRWDQVVPVLEVSREAGARTVALLGRREFRARPPRSSSLDSQVDEVARFDESRRVDRVRELAWHEAVYARCPGARAMFESNDTPLSEILAALPAAIEQCDCAVEVPAVEAHLWGLAGRIGRPGRLVVRHIELAGDDSRGATVVALGPDTPWSRAVERLAAVRGPVHPSVNENRGKEDDE